MAFFTLPVDGVSGPVISAWVGVSEARQQALNAAELPVPTAQLIRALVDTGASGTCIDPTILQALQLTPTGTIAIHTPSSGPGGHQTEQYDVALMIPGANQTHVPLWRGTIPVMCCDLYAAQGIHALIGRDVLSDCVLVYNGRTQLFTLAF